MTMAEAKNGIPIQQLREHAKHLHDVCFHAHMHEFASLVTHRSWRCTLCTFQPRNPIPANGLRARRAISENPNAQLCRIGGGERGEGKAKCMVYTKVENYILGERYLCTVCTGVCVHTYSMYVHTYVRVFHACMFATVCCVFVFPKVFNTRDG